MLIITYEVTLASKDGYEKKEVVSAESCISALHKAKADCGGGWSVKNYEIKRID